MKYFSFLLVISMFLLVSCGSKPDQEEVASMLDSLKEVPATTPSDSDQFGFKTGVIIYTSSTMGISQEVTMWFDDFGRITMSEIESSVLGQKMHQLNIVKDSMVYNIDMVSKTGTWIAAEKDSADQMYNYRKLTPEDMKLHNITDEGKESVLGKECHIYSQKETVEGQEVVMKVWIWEGLPLKSVSSVSGIEVTMEALNMKMNIDIPSGKFEVPAGVKMAEYKERDTVPDSKVQ